MPRLGPLPLSGALSGALPLAARVPGVVPRFLRHRFFASGPGQGSFHPRWGSKVSFGAREVLEEQGRTGQPIDLVLRRLALLLSSLLTSFLY
jgi:hypothetical protein